MKLFAHKSLFFQELAKTGFLASLAAYAVFWFTEFFVPGFVSHFFSVHDFLLSALVCSFVWTSSMRTYVPHSSVRRLLLAIFGIGLAVLTFHFTKELGVERFFLVVVACFMPVFLSMFINETE